MTDKTTTEPQCSNCFFVRLSGTTYTCHRRSMTPMSGPEVWPVVADDDWCGEGWDQVNGYYNRVGNI